MSNFLKKNLYQHGTKDTLSQSPPFDEVRFSVLEGFRDHRSV